MHKFTKTVKLTHTLVEFFILIVLNVEFNLVDKISIEE